MWSVYLDTNPLRLASTRALGSVSRRAYFGPLAPLRARNLAKTQLPGRRWVRVRNSMAGISGADVALVHLEADPRVSLLALPRQPRIYLGREVCGEVIDIGPEVEFLRVGDRIAYQLDQPIGGGWSDEMLIHERQAFLVPDSLSDEQAALLEPCAVAVHAALRHQPQPGDNVLVMGAGTLGLLTTQAIRALSPNAHITVLARYPFQVEMATHLGATRMLYPEEGSAGVARLLDAQHFKRRLGAELLIGGFDVVYDTVGSSATLQQALRWVRGAGTVVLVGSRMTPMRLDMTPVWHQEVTLIGATAHGTEGWPGNAGLETWSGGDGGRVSTFALAAALVRERRLTPQRLITHRFPLREVRRAVETARHKAEHHAIKVLLDIRDVPEVQLDDIEAITQGAGL